MRQIFTTSTAVCLSLLACGGNSNNKTVNVVDAKGSGSGSGSGSDVCQAKATYAPTFGSNDDQQAQLGTSPEAVAYLANISEANPVDLLDIELWTGSMDFAGSAAATGTFTLSAKGDDNYASCGACALVWPQVAVGSDGSLTGLDGAAGSAFFATHQYMASGGTMTLTSVTGTLTGSLSNVTMRNVDIVDGSDSLTQTDDPSGCKTTVTSVSFTAAIGSAGFVGSTTFGMPVRVNLRNRHR
jgi:hypothetical protein